MPSLTSAERAANEVLARMSDHYRRLGAVRCELRLSRSDAPGAMARYALAVRPPSDLSLVLQQVTASMPQEWTPSCSLMIDAERIVVLHQPADGPSSYSERTLPDSLQVGLSSALFGATPDTVLTPFGREATVLAALLGRDPATLLAQFGRPVHAGEASIDGCSVHRIMLIDDEEPAEQFRHELLIASGEEPWLLSFVTIWGTGLARTQGQASGAVERLDFRDWSEREVSCAAALPPPGAQRVELLTPLLLPPDSVDGFAAD